VAACSGGVPSGEPAPRSAVRKTRAGRIKRSGMTPAELAALRGACGPTYRATGRYLGTGLRSVQRWEEREVHLPVPAFAAYKLVALDAQIRTVVDAVLVLTPVLAPTPRAIPARTGWT
jgi:DNA-binding transcriptional regulator YiaG